MLFVLVISTNVSKKPVTPSARYHCAAGASTPPELWPPRCAAPGQVIERSTTMSTSDSTIADTAPGGSPVTPLTMNVARLVGCTTSVCGVNGG